MKNQTFNRLAFIDVAKGLGIIAVVAGHVCPPGIIHSLIFVFHMPLFFFISGYLFKPKDHKEFIAAKLQQLIIPYFSFLVIIYAVQNQVFFYDGALTFSQRLSLWGKALLGGRWLYGYTSAFWFAPVLFMVLLTANWLMKNSSKQRLVLLTLAALTAAYVNAFFFPSLKIPLNANVVLAALPLFLAGYFFKERSLTSYQSISYLFLALVAVAACFGQLPAVDMKMAAYGFPVLSFVVAIAISLLIFQLAKLIAEKWQRLSNILSVLGKASLVIMFLHQPVQILLQEHVTDNNYLRIMLALIVPYLFYLLFKSNAVCRALFLGSTEDVAKLSTEAQEFFSAVLLKAKL